MFLCVDMDFLAGVGEVGGVVRSYMRKEWYDKKIAELEGEVESLRGQIDLLQERARTEKMSMIKSREKHMHELLTFLNKLYLTLSNGQTDLLKAIQGVTSLTMTESAERIKRQALLLQEMTPSDPDFDEVEDN